MEEFTINDLRCSSLDGRFVERLKSKFLMGKFLFKMQWMTYSLTLQITFDTFKENLRSLDKSWMAKHYFPVFSIAN